MLLALFQNYHIIHRLNSELLELITSAQIRRKHQNKRRGDAVRRPQKIRS